MVARLQEAGRQNFILLVEAGRSDKPVLLKRRPSATVEELPMAVPPRPEEALCDGPQQIPAGEFADFAAEIERLVALMGKTIG